MSETLEIVYIPITEAINLLHAKNPKRHDIGDLCRSIERYGFVDPPKINHGSPNKNGTDGGAFVYGNGRVEAVYRMFKDGDYGVPRGVKQLDNGEWAIPVKTGVDLAPGEADAFLVDHNNLTLSGGDFTAQDLERMWEVDGLHAILDDLSELDALPISLDGDYLDGAKANEQAGADTEAQVDKAEAEKYQEIWQVKPGDVWQLGRHKIACLDSLDEMAVKTLIGGATVGMVWADPPYGVGLDASYKNSIDNPVKGIKASKGYPNVIGDDKPFDVTPYLKAYSCKEQFWWGADYYRDTLPPGGSWVVWDKRAGMEVNWTTAEFELCWSMTPHRRIVFSHRWFGLIGTEQEDIQRRLHPTQKPIALAQWAFEKYGKPGDVIFDPFLGSGISVLAAERLDDGRQVIGCELAPEYVATTIQRWKQHSNIEPKLLTNA